MPKTVVALLVALALLAGCAQPSEPEPEPQPDIQYQDETIAVQDPSLLPRDPPAEGERNLETAPAWRLGEWWKYRLTEEFSGASYEFYRVVAGAEAGNYLVGFPVNEFSNDILVLHIPGYGDISRTDLSYETHDAPFKLLQFPLRDGDSWDMTFEGASPGTAMVEVPGDGTAIIHAPTQSFDITAVYDPALGEIRSLQIPGYASYEVIGHGYDWGSQPMAGDGIVRVPHDHDLVFINGRLGGVHDLGSPLIPPSPAGPTETITVEGGYDRIGFTIILGTPPGLVPAAGGVAPPTGYYSGKAAAPDGTVYELVLMPNEDPLKVEFFGHDAPTGDWNMEYVAGGAGVVLIEGIGYHSIDVDLPSGCVIASFNAQHHAANCLSTYDEANQDGAAAPAATPGA
jgi:hypothetical protein